MEPVMLLSESQKKDRQAFLADVSLRHEALRESIKKSTGVDPNTVDWSGPKFSWKKLRDEAVAELQEANVGSSLSQLFRYGIQNYLFDGYKQTPTVYEDIVRMIPSTNVQEWYAPLYGAEEPEDVAAGGPFNDQRVEGMNTTLVNKKVGRLLSLERELFDDDQTGQIAQRPALAGQRMKIKEEKDVMTALLAATYSATLTGGGANRPASYGVLTQATLQAADVALANMFDPLGNDMLVIPSLLLVNNSGKFDAAVLMNSSLNATGAQAAGVTGGVMSNNPLYQLYDLKWTRFGLAAADWFLMEPKTGFPFQNRDPLEVVQENPLSGLSFSNEVYRWKVRRRYQTQVVESRFIYAGKIT